MHTDFDSNINHSLNNLNHKEIARNDFDKAKSWQKLNKKLHGKKKVIFLAWHYAAAAAIIIFLFCGFLLQYIRLQHEQIDLLSHQRYMELKRYTYVSKRNVIHFDSNKNMKSETNSEMAENAKNTLEIRKIIVHDTLYQVVTKTVRDTIILVQNTNDSLRFRTETFPKSEKKLVAETNPVFKIPMTGNKKQRAFKVSWFGMGNSKADKQTHDVQTNFALQINK